MEFGSSSMKFTIMGTLALLNFLTVVVVIKKFVMDINFKGLNLSIMQIILCGLVVTVNLPIYQGLFIRTDKGNIPSSIMFKSTVLASLMCFTPIYWDTSPCIIIFL